MNKPLKSLTGLRFFAAFTVVMLHFGLPRGHGFARNIVLHGFVAVTLFFVLSGFILTYKYFDDSGNIRTSKYDFWVARFARIYPVYMLGFVLFAPYAYTNLVQSGSPSSWADFSIFAAETLGLVQSWSNPAIGVWNPPGWSLSAEVFFYLLFPIIAPVILKLRFRPLVLVAVTLWVASIGAQFAYLGSAHYDRKFWMFNPLVRLPEFLLGIVLARLWRNRRLGRFDVYSGRIAIGTTALILVLLAFPADEIWFANGMMAPAMMLLIYCLASGRGVAARRLGSRPMILLGESSYALYLLHWPLFLALRSYLADDLQLIHRGPILFFVCAVLVIAASIVTFKFLERPANHFIRKALAARSKARTSVPKEELHG
jgi:peptidoglycan/LPS O-acetylase OafA/YrhL